MPLEDEKKQEIKQQMRFRRQIKQLKEEGDAVNKPSKNFLVALWLWLKGLIEGGK